jgi:hypothetical protein
MHPVLPVLNLLAAAAGAIGGVVGLAQPAAMSKSNQVTPGELFYARMYAVRALPLGIVAGLLPFWHRGPAVTPVLVAASVAASVVQVADVVIGAGRNDLGMMTGASIAAIIHIVSAYAIQGAGDF